MRSLTFKDLEIKDMKGTTWLASGGYWSDQGEEGLTNIRLSLIGNSNDPLFACETDATIPDIFSQSSIGQLIDDARNQMLEDDETIFRCD